ncbi:MAG TPA: sulfite exporter TauE/SafE family protein [Bacteroidota bacterium]|nr:sulfite exporter TauE/SafE family protein [Bacteroidota bacterium]
MEILLPVVAGFTLGCIHAFDADHVVAVTAFASKTRNAFAAAKFGFLWGLGHTATLVLLGLFSLAFRFMIPPLVESIAEIAVGMLLVAIGVWVLRGVAQRHRLHIHRHTHDGTTHVHLHSHARSEDHRHRHSMFLVGATHGFAGTASVMVMIPVAMTQTVSVAALYLVLFGIGTMLAMSVFAFVVGQISARIDSPRTIPIVQVLSGTLSVAVGCLWIGEKIL